MKRILLIVSAILIIILTIFIVALPRIAERIAFKGSSAELAGYREWKNKPLSIPSDALDVRSYRPETVAAAKAFREQWEKQKDTALQVSNKYTRRPVVPIAGPAGPPHPEAPNSPILVKPLGSQPTPAAPLPSTASATEKPLSPALDGIDFDAANRDMATLDPLVQSFRALISQPDYEMSAAIGDVTYEENSGTPPFPNFLSLQGGAKLLRVQALSQMHDGKYKEALDTSALIVRSGQANPYDVLIQQLIGVAICSIGSRTWHDVVASCNDPALLRETLKQQNQIAKAQAYFKPTMSASEVDPAAVAEQENILLAPSRLSLQDTDMLGMLRECKRRGMTINLQSPTSRELSKLTWTTQADYIERFVLPQLGSKPEAAERSRKMAQSYRAMGGRAESVAAPVTEPFLYRIARPNFEEAITRAQVVRTKFDLLRLDTARRIYALEHGGKEPSKIEDLVPELLPVIPRDRFSSGKEKKIYKETEIGYYSLGPDTVDQKAALTYDSTNGTMSAGDILER